MPDINDPFKAQTGGIKDPFKSAAAPAPAAPAPEPKLRRSIGQVAGDTALGVARGAVNIGGSLATLSEASPIGALGQAKLAGAAAGIKVPSLARKFDDAGRHLDSKQSEVLQGKKQELAETEGFWNSAKKVVTEPALLGNFLAEQVPNLATVGGGAAVTGARAATLALPRLAAQGATREAAAVGARAAGKKAAGQFVVGSNTAIESGSAAQQAYLDALDQPDEVWQANPEYQRMVQGGLTPENAKEAMARTASAKALAVTAPIAAGASRLVAPFEADVFTGRLTRTPATIVGGIAREGTEEALQEGGSQFATNVGVQGIDPNRELLEGVPEAAGTGAALGVVLGGGMAAGGSLTNRGDQPTLQRPGAAEQQGPFPALPAPVTTVTPEGVATTETQRDNLNRQDAATVQQREALGLSADVNAARARHPGAVPNTATLQRQPTIPYPDAAPGSLSDIANTVSAAGGTAPPPAIEGEFTNITPAARKRVEAAPTGWQPPWVDTSTGEELTPTLEQKKSAIHDRMNFMVENGAGINRQAIQRALRLKPDEFKSVWDEVVSERKRGLSTVAPASADLERQVIEQARANSRASRSEGSNAEAANQSEGGQGGEAPAADVRGVDTAAVPAAGRGLDEGGVPASQEPAANDAPADVRAPEAVAPSPAAADTEGALSPNYDESSEILDSDITPPSGGAFENRGAADVQAKRVEGGRVFPVDGGFVVRTPTVGEGPAAGSEAASAQSPAPAAAQSAPPSEIPSPAAPSDQMDVPPPPATLSAQADTPPAAGDSVQPDLEIAGSPARPGARTLLADSDTPPAAGGQIPQVVGAKRPSAQATPAAGSPQPKVRVRAGKPSYDTIHRDTIAAYYQPGRTVDSYGGGKDRVLEFKSDVGDGTGRWSVKVQAVDKDGNPKMEGKRPAEPRWHSTAPLDRELRAAFGPPQARARKRAAKSAAAPVPAASGNEAIAAAAAQAATSPTNDLPAPTDAQKEAGNYKVGKARVNGHEISIENPAGSKRRPEWPALKHHYGYIRGTIGKDKDHVDVFLTDRADDPALPVFVVDQVNRDGRFDEHKVVMGTADEAAARKAYLANYAKGWTGLGAITQMSQEEFKTWVRDPKKTVRPAGDLSAITPSVKGSKAAPAAEPVAGAALRARWVADFDAVAAEYAAQTGEFDTEGGRILNTDLARELSPEYRANRGLSADVHDAASDFIKELYRRKLAAPTPDGLVPDVVLSAGGTGAGKSTGLKAASDLGAVEIIYDTNSNRIDSAVSKIEAAITAGRNVAVVYTYRDPVDALRAGALPRARRLESEFGSGRTVPLAEHRNTHVGAARTIRELADRYRDHPQVSFTFVDNSKGKGNQALVSLESLPQVEENQLHERLAESLNQAHAAGEISAAIHRGFLQGTRRELRAGDSRESPEADRRPGSVEASVDRPRGSGEPAFSRPTAGAQKGIDFARALRLKQQLTAKWGDNAPAVVLVEDAEGFPESAKADPDYRRAEGFYNGQPTVWLNVGKIQTAARFKQVLAHEALGHFGVERVIGAKQWNDITQTIGRLEQSGGGSASVRAVIADVRARYGDLDADAFAREVVAVMAERGLRNTFTQRVIAAVRRFLRSIMPSATWSESDIRDLLSQAESFLHAGRSTEQRQEMVRSFSFSQPRAEGAIAGNGQRSITLGGERFVDRSGTFYLTNDRGQPKDFRLFSEAQAAAQATGGEVRIDDAFEGERPSWSVVAPELVVREAFLGRGLFSKAPADIVADIEAISNPGKQEGLIAQAREWLDGITPKKLKDQLRPAWLGALTTRHLTELGTDYFQNIRHYSDYLTQMGADRNQLQVEGEAVAEAARQWASKHRAEARRLFDLMHQATIDGVDPAEAYQPLQFRFGGDLHEATPKNVKDAIGQVRQQMRERSAENKTDLMNEVKVLRGMPAREKARKAKYPTLVEQWNQLPPEAQQHYRAFRDLYRKRSEQVEAALIARINDTDAPEQHKRRITDVIRRQFESNRLQGVYFPLQRFGRFFVAAEKNGASTFLMFERLNELERATRDLKARGFTIKAQGLKQAGKAQDAPSGTFVAEVIGTLQKAHVSDKTQDEIYQLYLQSLPELSMRKHQVHRQSVPGWDPDAVRAFAFNMHHGAHQLARMRYSHTLVAVLDLLKRQQDSARKEEGADTRKIAAGDAILEELNRRHEWIMNPQDSQLTNIVSSVGFAYYLGATPAAALVNLSQTALVTYPYLAARYGGIKAMNALLSASKDAVRTVGNIQRTLKDSEEQQAHAALVASGALDKTQAHNLAGIAEGGMSGYNPAWAKAMEIIGWGFHKTEVVNREATGLAAFRLARADGASFDEAVKFAHDAIFDTHFDYTNANRARFMQSGTAKVLLMFRQYSLNMTWMLGRTLWQATKGQSPEVKRIARRQMAGILGMSALFSGVLGLPMSGVVMGVLNSIASTFGDDDEPWEAETEFRAFVTDLLGPDAAAVLLRGAANTVTGADIASRVGLSDLWFRDADRELEGRGMYYHLLEQIAGPVGGILKNALVGKNMIDEGHVWRGVETMLPKGIKDVMRAGRFATQGVNTLRGDPLMKDESLYDALLQGSGFTPARVSAQYQRNRDLTNYQKHITDRRQRLMDGFAMALRLGDEEARAANLRKIAAFNRANPEVAITPVSIRRSIQTRARYSARAESGIVLNPKLAARLNAAVGE